MNIKRGKTVLLIVALVFLALVLGVSATVTSMGWFSDFLGMGPNVDCSGLNGAADVYGHIGKNYTGCYALDGGTCSAGDATHAGHTDTKGITGTCCCPIVDYCESLGVDAVDIDDDGDGVYCGDNCLTVPNADQADFDSDGAGDLCDTCFNYNNSCAELIATQGNWSSIFYPYSNNITSAAFYNYHGASSYVAEKYYIVESQRSELFAYINSLTNILSLGIIHDKIMDGSSGQVVFNFSGTGWDMATITRSDDGGEFAKPIAKHNYPSYWSWGACCTDGGIMDIANLTKSWNLTIMPVLFNSIDNWTVKNPGYIDTVAHIPNMSAPMTITYSASTAEKPIPPYPSDALLAFVTSSTYNANVGGLAGADNICNSLATQAGLQNISDTKFKAWLSNNTINAKDRFNSQTDAYYLLDGRKVANNFTELLTLGPENIININETGAGVTGTIRVWTGTSADGTHNYNNNCDSDHRNCAGWTNTSGIGYCGGQYGIAESIETWTDTHRSLFCGGTGRIYCFEDISICGNAVLEFGEDCDCDDFGGATVTSLGYASGELNCTLDCKFNVSGVIIPSPPPNGGGGGGGGGRHDKTCAGEGYACCTECETATAHIDLNKTCLTNKVCCEKCYYPPIVLANDTLPPPEPVVEKPGFNWWWLLLLLIPLIWWLIYKKRKRDKENERHTYKHRTPKHRKKK